MVGLGRKHRNDIEGGGLGFVCLIDFARLNEVLIALHRVLTTYNEKVGGALQYVISIREIAVELHSPVIAIQAPLEWKDCDFSIRSNVPGIDTCLVGQGSEPLFNKASVHYGALKAVCSLEKCIVTFFSLSSFSFS